MRSPCDTSGSPSPPPGRTPESVAPDIRAAADTLARATDALMTGVYDTLGQVVGRYNALSGALQQSTSAMLADALARYEAVTSAALDSTITRIGHAYSTAWGLPMPEVTEGELATRVAVMSPPAPLPRVGDGTIREVASPVVPTIISGYPAAPNNPVPVISGPRFEVRERPAPRTAPRTPPGVRRRRVPRQESPVLSPGMGPILVRPSAPGGETRETPVAPVARAPAEGDGGGEPPSGGGGVSSSPPPSCPPVHVHVHCAPGVTVTEGAPDGRDAPPAGTQFVSADPETDRLLDEQTKKREDLAKTLGGKVTDPADLQKLQRSALAIDIFERIVGRDVADAITSALKNAGTVQGCKDADTLNKAVKDIGVWVNMFLYGSENGKVITEESLLGQLRLGWKEGDTVGQILLGIVAPALSGVRIALSLALSLSGCDEPGFIIGVVWRALFGIVEKWAGVSFPEARARLEYLIGSLCAAMIPTAGDYNAMWLVGQISDEEWRCAVRSNGMRDDEFAKLRDAQRTVPSPLQITNVWQRLGLPREVLDQMLRRAGVIDQEHVEWFEELATYLPAPGDLVSFMVRDVFDQDVVDKYGYDDDLEKKFAGQVKDWARGQGMTLDQFKYYWRAHWQLPSPTQAYEMMHRLRPGRAGPDEVTKDTDVAQLLQINDVPLYWRRRLMAISYRPLTRVDTRRAYFIGSLSEQETFDAIRDLGYNDRDAGLLLGFWKQERVNWASNQPWAKGYVRGEVSDRELRERLGRLNLSANQQDALEQELELRFRQGRSKTRSGALRRRVLSGMADADDVIQELREAGFSPWRAKELAESWQEERGAAGKAPTAQQLCKLHDFGIISADEYASALLRIGYDPDSARKILALCAAETAEKAEKGSGREVARERREAEQQRSKEAREAYRRNLEMGRAKRKQRALSVAEERVQKKLTGAQRTLSKAFGGEIASHADAVVRLFRLLVEEKCYTRAGAAALVDEIVRAYAARRRSDWLASAIDYVGTLPQRPCVRDEDDGPPPAEERAVPGPD